MSANSVYRVVIDHKPEDPPSWAQWLATLCDDYETRYLWDRWFTAEQRAKEASQLWDDWRGGERFRYFSIASARGHVKRLAKHGVVAHVEGGRIEWVVP